MRKILRYDRPEVLYFAGAAIVMLGFARYDPYQIDGDAVSYMDIASAIQHGRWNEVVNGLWNPGYPALLALGKLVSHADRLHELKIFYFVNYFIFLGSLACTAFFVRAVIRLRWEGDGDHPERPSWLLPEPLLYLAAYAVVFLSWQREFSPAVIRVDGLFASCLLLAFGSLLRMYRSTRLSPGIAMGAAFGAAYMVKSPGLVIGAVAYLLLAALFLYERKLKINRWRLILSVGTFIAVIAPYIAALSVQKGRLDTGDSGRLNYAWYVSGTEPLHLLNDQPERFGHAVVHLKNPQLRLLANPTVVAFPHFQDAAYGPWFDPSYFNEGVIPRFSLPLQLGLLINQSRHFVLFLDYHSMVLAVLIVYFYYRAFITKRHRLRGLLLLLYGMVAFSFLMYLCVHFLDRYVAGIFWVATIATVGLLEVRNQGKASMLQGATVFMAIAILLLGVHRVVKMRQSVIFNHVKAGYQDSQEFDVARMLWKAGVRPGSSVACFRACNTGSYWARLSNVHVTAEIFDPAYIADTGDGARMWSNLPNKPAILDVLRRTGASALVGFFEQPPASATGWMLMAGNYYYLPL